MRKHLLLILTTLLLFTLRLNAQTFRNTYSSLWISGPGVSTSLSGLSFNNPLSFSGNFPTLNLKYPSSVQTNVFYVMKSSLVNTKVFSLYYSGIVHNFSTSNISSISNINLNQGLVNKGAIVNYDFYNKSFKKNKSGILYLNNSALQSGTDFYELIICSNCNTSKITNSIQTYLALKYGITLERRGLYFNSKNIQVWDDNVATNFSNIIGIVRDDFFDFEKSATYSNVDNFMVLYHNNSRNGGVVDHDNTYILVGDDNGLKQFDTNGGKFKRTWFIQNKGDWDDEIDIIFNYKPDVDSEYFISHDLGTFAHDLSNINKLVFNKIKVRKGLISKLVLEEKKKLNFKINKTPNTLNTHYFLGVNEVGEAPFYVVATDMQTKQTYSFVGEKSEFPIENLPKSTYSFVLNDVEGKQAKLENIAIDLTEANLVNLSTNWNLQDNQTVVVKPSFSISTIAKELEYKWYFKDKLIAHTPTLLAYQIGDYRLELTDNTGKKQVLPFAVGKLDSKIENLNEQWYVTPNPTKVGEEFTIHYDLSSNKKVDFYIYTVDGKFVLKDELGIIKSGSYNYRLNGATTYLLIPIINSKASMQKLIVK